jgi:L-histidine N-alpha-methyltransferase
MNIATDFQTFEAQSLAPLDTREALIDEVWSGLLKRPRSLVPWMLYDSEGSRLFECITTLPEYYPTRTERDILASYAEAIITATGSDYSRPLRLLELGAGTGAKTGILLEAATRLRNEVIYLPVDVSSGCTRRGVRQHRLPVSGCASTANGSELRHSPAEA